MPQRNRILHSGAIIAGSAREMYMANRGIRYYARRARGLARRPHHRMCCWLSLPDHKRVLRAPDRYTNLYFLDEPVCPSASQLPVTKSRREPNLGLSPALEAACGPVGRVAEPEHLRHDGTMIALDRAPWPVQRGRLHRCTSANYAATPARLEGTATVFTPDPAAATLGAGFRPALHESATA